MIESLFRVDVALFLLIGILGGAHCIGMCGPLVTLYSKRCRPNPMAGLRRRRVGTDAAISLPTKSQHALFNVGQAGTYAVLGAVFGALGD